MRLINKNKIAFAMYYTGILHTLLLFNRTFNIGKPVILMGHRILPKEHISGPSEIDQMALLSGHALSTTEFEKRIKFFMRYYKTGDPKDLTTNYLNNRKVYITIDDGYIDNIEYAEPILKRNNIKAVIFLIGDILNQPNITPWWDAWGQKKVLGIELNEGIGKYSEMCMKYKQTSRGLYRDSPAPYEKNTDEYSRLYISHDEASSIHKRGNFYFGNHTMSHPNLNKLSNKELDEEIGGSIKAIENIEGYLPLLAYPFGYCNDKVKNYLADNTNIKNAFCTGNGSDTDNYSLRRINLNNKSFALLLAEALNVFKPFNALKGLF